MADDFDNPPKAYENKEFLKSSASRPLRIMAEFFEPEDRFERYNISDTVVFFGSARIKSHEQAEAALAAAKRHGGDLDVAQHDLAMSRYYEEARELASRLTQWSKSLKGRQRRFVVCTGGGPGIMEAANRGASEAGGLNVGLNITLPHEQSGNPWTSRELNFQFHYFFMRKFWFAYPAKAVIIFPGGFGTMDEFFELMTLITTGKMGKTLPVFLYGADYWNEIINFDAMVKFGTISAGELEKFNRVNTTDEAFAAITEALEQVAMTHPGTTL
ncbi:hypothetical protein EDD55_10947 [Varunaivibrio sulfuroxidans]|uniref:AMP nucleosidase n=2 Tax=Varunaivibrio sulfuroxidans TaxID=1773489 RepID=A0A4R3J698_9PROT|nr:hypothetical protein EDD55_10947 [Varunaivibrio sulfuroxidans]